jgi:hypothetical protein
MIESLNTPAKIQRAIFAGNCSLSIRSRKSRVTLFFNIKAANYRRPLGKDDRPSDVFYVSYSSREDIPYKYLGSIFKGDGNFKRTRKSPPYMLTARYFEAFDWFWDHVKNNKLPAGADWDQVGSCCACGRPLTDPLSIRIGMGPTCRAERDIDEYSLVEPWQPSLI